MKGKVLWGFIVLFLSLALAGLLTDFDGRLSLLFVFITVIVLFVSGIWIWQSFRDLRQGDHKFIILLLKVIGVLIGLVVYLYFSSWLLIPDLLPQYNYYGLISNHHVTERLVDPELLKVEQWEVLGEDHEVLFVHPGSSGSTALVYPVKIEPQTILRAYLAMAPGSWSAEGDGVTYSIYVEDEAGFHLLFSQYIDPKHQQQDRRWIPIQVKLSEFKNKLVRLILVVNSGPAGDTRYDWAGWGEPRLERPMWP